MKKLKTITTYSGHSRFLGECEQDGDGYAVVGYIPRPFAEPYHYSPTKEVLSWRGKRIIVAEVRHKRYVVFEIDASTTVYEEQDAAQEAYLAIRRGRIAGGLPELEEAPK